MASQLTTEKIWDNHFKVIFGGNRYIGEQPDPSEK